jgi:hypothetical protein
MLRIMLLRMLRSLAIKNVTLSTVINRLLLLVSEGHHAQNHLHD